MARTIGTMLRRKVTVSTMNIADLIAQSKRDTEQAAVQLLRTFEFVPEDRLNWSPSPTARTALQIVAHCRVANGMFAALLRGEALPLSSNPEEAAAQLREGGKDVSTRSAAMQSVKNSTTELLEALDKVSADMVSTEPVSPFGSFPFPFWMRLPGEHMKGHARQIDYLQTVWGDLENHG
jgi:hypothetical protein